MDACRRTAEAMAAEAMAALAWAVAGGASVPCQPPRAARGSSREWATLPCTVLDFIGSSECGAVPAVVLRHLPLGLRCATREVYYSAGSFWLSCTGVKLPPRTMPHVSVSYAACVVWCRRRKYPTGFYDFSFHLPHTHRLTRDDGRRLSPRVSAGVGGDEKV